MGLILAPWVVSRVEPSGWPVAKAAARLAALGAASFLVMALVPLLPVYVAGCVLAMTTSSAAIPLLTQMYQENYPDRERGRRFARDDDDPHCDRGALQRPGGPALCPATSTGSAGCCDLCRRLCFRELLSRALSFPAAHRFGGTHPFHALRYVRDDRLFRQTLIAWMFLGFAC